MLIFDAHCDVLSVINKPEELFSNTCQWDAQRALSNGPYIQVFSAFGGVNFTENYKSIMEEQFRLAINAQKLYPEKLKIIRNVKDLKEAASTLSQTKLYAILEAEGAEILGGSLDEVDKMFDLGLRVLTLTWNFDNELCDSIAGNRRHKGLSSLGREVIHKAQKLGILIDVSHASDEAFDQVIEITQKPIMASHSNARALCKQMRNLTDAQIKAIAKTGGVIGINFYPDFLVDSGNAHFMDIIRNIEYISALVGTRHVGFGSDFDGIDATPAGINGVEDYVKIIEALLKLNYAQSDVEAIASGNFVSLLEQTLPT